MKNIKTKKAGITLIALVLTIIVLLILAGITINLTIGEGGIIKRAEEAGQTYKEAAANEVSQLNSFEASVIPGKVAKIVDGVQYVGDGMGSIIPVPVGFSYLEGTKSTGFVIKNNTDGNEFVWVPCTLDGANGSIKYDRYAYPGKLEQGADGIDTITNSIRIRYKNTMDDVFTEAIPNDERTSVNMYGGFYIGRYETGITGYTSLDKSTTNTQKEYTGYTGGNAVIKPNQQVWNYITRDKAKKVSEDLYKKSKGDSVNSKLCSSYAWDTALKFIETKNEGYSIRGNVGNYKDRIFNYIDFNGDTQIKEENSTILVPTGQTMSVNNIYDMGGNVWEWTTENFSDVSNSCTIRGGSLWDVSVNTPAAERYYYSDIVAYGSVSFRMNLFL